MPNDTASAPMASRVNAVSLSDSPLETDEPLAEKVITSAAAWLPIRRTVECRRILEEVHDRATPKGWQLLHRTLRHGCEFGRRVQNHERLGSIEISGGEQVLTQHLHHRPTHYRSSRRLLVDLHETHTPSRPWPWEVLSDEVRSDRQFAMAPINHHCQPRWPVGLDHGRRPGPRE